MTSQDAALFAAVIGLGSVIAFAQTSKMGLLGPFARFAGLAQIPAAIACLWVIAIRLGWWTIAVFIAASLIVGVINGRLIRRHGRAALLLMQPMLAAAYLGGALAACGLFLLG